MASVASKSTGQEAPVPPEVIPYDYSGADFKSVLINISSIAFFLLPFTLYFLYKKEEQDLPVSRTMAYYGTVATPLLLYCVAYFAPPVGWRKPHPYSDDARNVPYNFRAKSH